ncbi:hypothetical protein Lepto7375DRAFT_0753 [Leptolyngbya sp. PCC 7375]|nr:hypothetical protein Lepto7375DRAFT_0753 [Leptolyngbya sp. PCC 7375]
MQLSAVQLKQAIQSISQIGPITLAYGLAYTFAVCDALWPITLAYGLAYTFAVCDAL